jgi:hypothetical protein
MTHSYLFAQTLKKEEISCPAFHPGLTQQPISCPAFHPGLTPPPDNTENKEIKISQFTRDFFYHHNKPVWFN